MKVPTLARKRKFVVAMTALVMSFVLALIGAVSGGEWVGVTSSIVGLYAGAEAWEGAQHGRS